MGEDPRLPEKGVEEDILPFLSLSIKLSLLLKTCGNGKIYHCKRGYRRRLILLLIFNMI